MTGAEVLVTVLLPLMAISVPWGEHPPLAWSFGKFVWGRAIETDAGKASRYLAKSQRFLVKARDLGIDAQRITGEVEAEFERRLRLVADGVEYAAAARDGEGGFTLGQPGPPEGDFDEGSGTLQIPLADRGEG